MNRTKYIDANLMRKREWLVFSIILTLGIFLRFYKFDSIPFGLNHDSGLFGLVAIDLWQRLPSYTPFYAGWVGETMYHYILGIYFFLFGISPTTLKFASLSIGIALLPVFYLLAKKLQGSFVALGSLFFLAISGWHIIMSKAGWSVILVPVFQCISFILFYDALKKGKTYIWILAGSMIGLTLYTYGASRITPLIATILSIGWIFANKVITRSLIKNIFLLILSCFITIIPLLNFAINDWDTYTSRMRFLSITNGVQQEGIIRPIVNNIITSLKMLHVRANGDDFFVNEPLLEMIPGFLFIIGFFSLLFSIRKFESLFVMVWLLTGFLPGIISVPNGNHNFSILAPVYLIIGRGISVIPSIFSRFSKQLSLLGHVIICLLLFVSVAELYKQYFSQNRHEFFGFYPETTIVANYMRENSNLYNFYLTDNYPRDALTFITYNGGNPFQKHYQWLERGIDFLNVENTSGKGLMFFMLANNQNEILASQLLNKFPKSEEFYLWYSDNNILRKASLVVRVPPQK